LGNDVLWTSDMFEGFDLCVLGHIHKPQQVKGTENAWYVGSPCPVSFNEADQQKTLFVWDGAPLHIPIDGPAFKKFTLTSLAEYEEDWYTPHTFAKIIKGRDDPDPEKIPGFEWYEIIPLPPERDIRQRLDAETAMAMKPMEVLEEYLSLEGEGDKITEVLALAKELMGREDGA